MIDINKYIEDVLAGKVWVKTVTTKTRFDGEIEETLTEKQVELPATILAQLLKDSKANQENKQLDLLSNFTIEVVKVEPEAL